MRYVRKEGRWGSYVFDTQINEEVDLDRLIDQHNVMFQALVVTKKRLTYIGMSTAEIDHVLKYTLDWMNTPSKEEMKGREVESAFFEDREDGTQGA